jgi:ribokinase
MVRTHKEGPEILGIGVAVRDIAVLLDEFPVPDEKFRAKGLFEAGGGPVPTALVTLTRLGHRASFCGVVGMGAAGHFIVDSLDQEGIDTHGVVFRAGFPSPTSVILVEGGRRTIFEWRQYDLPLSFDELEAKQVPFEDFRFLLVDARLPEVQIEAARRVRGAGGKVVLDCGHPRAGVEDILALTDVAILSHTYPRTLLGDSYDLEGFLTDLAARLPEDGPRIAGLTLGADGCAILAPDSSFVRVPGHKVTAVDSTGAGDVFHGAFLHAFMGGSSPEEAARFANAAAALKCKGMTGRSPLPPDGEIWRFARSQ